MKKALVVILAVLIIAASGFAGFIALESSKGISYDISSVEKLSTDIEIVSVSEDSVTVKKMSEGEFRVIMFTDTHLKGDKELDNITVSYMVENIKEQQPDLVILGGDVVTYGFNKKRNIEVCELFEQLGVYWAAVLGNHEGDGFMMLPREDVIDLYASYEHCLITAGKEEIDGNGNCTVNVLNSDGSLREVFFLLDSGAYMTEDAKKEYSVTKEGDVYDGVRTSQVQWYKDKHDALQAEYGEFSSVTVMHIPPFEAEREYSDEDFIYGEKREGVCESGFDAGIVNAMLEKGSTSAVFFGHDHLNNFGVMYEDIILSYIQPSGYAAYNMQSKFDAPESEWIQGCTLLKIAEDGTFVSEAIYNHK